MDRQNREGGKTGSGHGLLTDADRKAHQRRRLVSLVMDAADLSNDPFLIRNHLGQYECLLCMTIHTNEGSYLAHTQAKKHQSNLGRRAARQAAQQQQQQQQQLQAPKPALPPTTTGLVPMMRPRIGRPAYTMKRIRDSFGRVGLLLHLHLPHLTSTLPAYRIMSAFEQRLEAPNRSFQYLLVAGEPYETVAFKIPNRPVVQDPHTFFAHWDPDFKVYSVQLLLENNK